MRAREPDYTGRVERDGVSVGYEVFGDGEPTIVLLTSWAIVHMRQWKAQVPYLSRHFRVITVEGRGNGRADRPDSADAYTDREYVDDAIAVMDATGTDRAVLVGPLPRWAARPAARGLVPGARSRGRRDRDGAALAAAAGLRRAQGQLRGLGEGEPALLAAPTTAAGSSSSCPRSSPSRTRSSSGRTASAGGWRPTPRPCCTRRRRSTPLTDADAEAICRAVRCPVLVVHGDGDGIVPYETGVALARWTGGRAGDDPGRRARPNDARTRY